MVDIQRTAHNTVQSEELDFGNWGGLLEHNHMYTTSFSGTSSQMTSGERHP